MIKCLNSLFCKEIRIESDGSVSLLSIYSGFSGKNMPLTAPLCFIAFLELSIQEYKNSLIKELELRVLVNAAWGPTIGDTRYKVLFKQTSETTAKGTLLSDYGRITFTEFGQYSFEIFIDNLLINTNILEVVQTVE